MTDERIEALEREVALLRGRFWWLLVLVTLCAVSLACDWNQCRPDVVEVQAFVLKDARGEVAAELRVARRGSSAECSRGRPASRS